MVVVIREVLGEPRRHSQTQLGLYCPETNIGDRYIPRGNYCDFKMGQSQVLALLAAH